MAFKSPADAEQMFYAAFAQQDMEAMMQVWAVERPVFCIHPGGDLLIGREAVAQSWQQIFRAEAPFHFELEHHYREEFAQQYAISHLTETLYVQQRIVGVVLATNSFAFAGDGWRMVMHHASPKPEAEPPNPPIFH